MHQDRITRLGLALEEHGFDAAALIPGPTLNYLTGLAFHLMERPVIGLFAPGTPPHLVLPELERAKAEAAPLDLILHPYGEAEAQRLAALSEAVSQLELDGKRIGVEPLRLRFYELRLLEAAAPGATLADGGPALANLRLHKEAQEIEWMRRAAAIAEKALRQTLPLVRLGMSERELAAELTLQLLRAGSEPELPFPPIVAAGPNSALPHAVPGERALQAGDLLLLDWGATYHGYVSDLTRVFSLGEPDAELARVYQVVLEANLAGRAAVRPGASCGTVDHAARAVIEAAGYGPRFLHRTGHGLGLEAHEPPFIRQDNAQPLARGMVFTIEPGVYLEGRGGVRIEDDLVVTESGAETLTSYPRQLQVIA